MDTRKLRKHHLGDWGEKLVLLRLRDHGFEVEPRGGFGAYDIDARRPPDDRIIRVEVKTSKWKNEGLRDRDGGPLYYWGWLVKDRDRHELRFDFLVGVAEVARDIRGARFFIFSHAEAAAQPSLKPRPGVKPKNVEKKIDLFGSKVNFDRARASDLHLFSPLEEQLNTDPSQFEDQWSKIR